ncbi:hypothetical protein DEO72_LG3g1523 [Vigna unguiculata]|uniref:Uncharacterized protein n=1 Tax=Vigna unguiculata TaxID=3917 RepID=A0A4D6LEG6_VIGUN|nr:hypothetical protein DEO72_LG3g1523 [Vigna unguiculata]
MIILLHRDRVVWVRNQRVNVVIICLVRWEFKWRSFLPPEEIAKSSLLEKVEYEWVAPEISSHWNGLTLLSAFAMIKEGQNRGISMLDTFSQSFKHFKDNFFKVVVKEPGRSYFYNEDGSTKFPFWLTDNPRRFKGMKKGELSTVDREVVEILGRFSNKLPTKGLVRVYLLVHPVVDLEELLETFVCRDIDINLAKAIISSIDNMRPNAMIKSMLKFNSKTLMLGRIEDNKELKEKYADIEIELEDLKKYIIQEHINGFNIGLRHATSFCKEVDASHPNCDINKDIIDGRLVDEEEMSADQSVEEPEGEMLILWMRRRTKCKIM